MIQFSIINQPDLNSGYTLDDNARALVAMCQHFELTNDWRLNLYRYYQFIHFCQQKTAHFELCKRTKKKFTDQNSENLEDSNGAIWALGFMISMSNLLPKTLILEARKTMQSALANTHKMHSTSNGFTIKGIYYANKRK
jgi:hypothetical protein